MGTSTRSQVDKIQWKSGGNMKMWHMVTGATLALLAGHTLGGTEDGILGTWVMPEGVAKIEIYRCKEKYCGKLVWLKDPNFAMDDEKDFAGKPKVDRHNPDPARRGEPVVGKQVLQGLTQNSAHTWNDGEIYDTKSGTTYQCKAVLTQQGTLEFRGFVGVSLFGRTSVWTR
jgi:uncharacterized protein (DUF2147 family)